MRRWTRVGRWAVSVLSLFLVCSALFVGPTVALAQRSDASDDGRRSPALAAALSVVVPGGGQAYNGQWRKAAVVFGTTAVGVGLFGLDGATCAWDDDGENCTRAAVGLGVVGAVLLYSWIDAPLTARSLNRRIELGEGMAVQFGPSFLADLPTARGRVGDFGLVRVTF